MYNLLEHSSSYSDATDSLQFYSKDEANNFNANIEDNSAFKSFKFKAKLLENPEADLDNKTLKSTNNRRAIKEHN